MLLSHSYDLFYKCLLYPFKLVYKVCFSFILVEETTGWIKCRTVLGVMGFLGFAVVYAMRVNLSVAIVAMVNTTKPIPSNDSTLDVCPATPSSNNSEPLVSFIEF